MIRTNSINNFDERKKIEREKKLKEKKMLKLKTFFCI